MHNAENDLNIVILDACRDNPYSRSFRSGSNGLARMDAPKGTLIAYSTSPGNLAADGTGRNSPYAASLLRNIDVPGLPIEQVFKRTRSDLDKLTNGMQIPWEATSLTGDFYFSPQRGISVEPQRQPGGRPAKYAESESSPSYEAHSNAIETDGRFERLPNGTVRDRRTRLVWASTDSSIALTWDAAGKYCEQYREGGYSNWRLPTLTELGTLYDRDSKNKHGFPVTRLIDLSECCPWSSDVQGGTAAYYFNFNVGRRDAHLKDVDNFPRALPVRQDLDAQ